jgi:hypothetical protein
VLDTYNGVGSGTAIVDDDEGGGIVDVELGTSVVEEAPVDIISAGDEGNEVLADEVVDSSVDRELPTVIMLLEISVLVERVEEGDGVWSEPCEVDSNVEVWLDDSTSTVELGVNVALAVSESDGVTIIELTMSVELEIGLPMTELSVEMGPAGVIVLEGRAEDGVCSEVLRADAEDGAAEVDGTSDA